MTNNCTTTKYASWSVRRGYLLTESGAKVCRVDDYGVLWIWDKRRKREVPLVWDIIKWAWKEAQEQKGRVEP